MIPIPELMKNARSITKKQLFEVLSTENTPNKSATVITITDATYKKKNPLGTIYKLSNVDVELNINYAEQKKEKDPSYNPKDSKKIYGTHVTSSLVEHNGKWYLQVQPKKADKPDFFVKSPDKGLYASYKKEVSDYLSPVKVSENTETEVAIRRYSFDSIIALNIDGTTYQV
jgi:hypothetical protein